MPDTTVNNQLQSRTTTSNRWPRKWATLGGHGTSVSTTVIHSTNDTDASEHVSTKEERQRNSRSLFRKSSTVSRTNDITLANDENSTPSLKKSRSLMNVLRAKLHSPAVLRRFRSKSRENAKNTVTEINGHTTTEPTTTEVEQNETKQSTTDQVTARKSRKRDPSPMRRLANRISQLTRHHSISSHERQKKTPEKSIENISQEEPTKSPAPIQNKDNIDYISACYDEIRAKYFNNNKNITTRNILNDDVQNRSANTLPMTNSSNINDTLINAQYASLLKTIDNPELQARKQSNIKLNCMLSGYTMTRSFASHEKSLGQNDLFNFHHYYDVGKRKYDWNSTNNTNRTYSSMKTRPISKSIDSFRHANINETTTPVKLERITIIDHDSLVQAENEENVPKLLTNENELVIREDSDLIEPKQQISDKSPDACVTPDVPLVDKTVASTNIIECNQTTEEQDEEFERNFSRAVERALRVVNNDQNNTNEPIYDIPKQDEQSTINLNELTENIITSINNSPLVPDETSKLEQNVDPIESLTIEPADSNDELPNTEEQKPIENEILDIDSIANDDVLSVINDLIQKIEDLLFEEIKNGHTFLVKLDEEEKTIKSKADAYNKILQSDDSRLTEDIRTDINAVIGEVNLLLRGKLKQFRGLCEKNVNKSTSGEPIPLDTDLEGFWDITYPLIDKVKDKFAKLDARKAKQWASIEEYDPNDVINRPRAVDDRLKQLQPHQNKSSKTSTNKPANDDLKKLIQERRKAAANTTNQNHDVEIFMTQK